MAWLPYKLIARSTIQKADIIHAVSEYEARLIKRDFRRDSIVIPNGVDEDVFRHGWDPPRDRVILCYAGRVERYKRLDLTLKVAQELKRRGIDTTLRVIGEGPELPRIKKIADQAKIELEVLGFLPREEYLRKLSTSTALVNLSDYEAYSIVTAEALAMGVPAIIAKPWAMTFEGMNRVYVVNKYDIREVVGAVTKVYGNVSNPAYGADSSRSNSSRRILPWRQIVEQVVQRLYLWN